MSTNNMQKRGFFITLEGVDGCGKSTQAQLLSDYIRIRNDQVILTREPGGTPLAEEIRRVILTPGKEDLDPMAEILLYAASRAQHVSRLIRPALAAGKTVVCERFVDSSLAYQGFGLGWDMNIIRQINRTAVAELEPDLTFLLNLETQQATKRIENRSKHTSGTDRIEQRGAEFQEKVRRGYLELAKNNPRIMVVETAGKSIDEVHSILKDAVITRFNI